MENMAITQETKRTTRNKGKRPGLVGVGLGIGIFLAVVLLIILGVNLVLFHKILPNTTISGIDVGGMRQEDAVFLVQNAITYPNSGVITYTFEGREWRTTPFENGLILDAESTVKQAYALGRTGLPWERIYEKMQVIFYGANISPVYLFNMSTAQDKISQIAQEINQPTVEAELIVNGLDVQMNPGQVGLSVDTWATAGMVGFNAQAQQNFEVPMVVVSQSPQILDASEQAQLARSILSQSLYLTVPNRTDADPEPWELDPATLAEMLSVQRVRMDDQEVFQVGLDGTKLAQLLESIATTMRVENPENARFIFNDETGQLELYQSAVVGREVNISNSITKINQEVAQGNHLIELAFDTQEPEVLDDATGAELGITELVQATTTYFYGSDAARKTNIRTSAGQYHGLLVAPGETFSMVDHIGDISLDNGYAEAWIIYGDQTIKGVGGGVCQVSTTLFRNAFFAGYPIAERHYHSYRVLYYEQNMWGGMDESLAGLDATVYAPLVDLKFVNDTPYWLLMETYVYDNEIQWKFYSTSMNRVVDWTSTGLTNIEEAPEPKYVVNEELSSGEIKQVDFEADGADVTVYRTVYQDGTVYLQDNFVTHYSPWRAVYECGPNTDKCVERDTVLNPN